jgi:hypothetical protein
VAHTQPYQQLALDIALGRVDGLYRLLLLAFVARDFYVNPRALSIRRQRNFRYGTQSYPRIAQLTFDNYADLFLQRLPYPRPVVRPAPMLRHIIYIPAKYL